MNTLDDDTMKQQLKDITQVFTDRITEEGKSRTVALIDGMFPDMAPALLLQKLRDNFAETQNYAALKALSNIPDLPGHVQQLETSKKSLEEEKLRLMTQKETELAKTTQKYEQELQEAKRNLADQASKFETDKARLEAKHAQDQTTVQKTIADLNGQMASIKVTQKTTEEKLKKAEDDYTNLLTEQGIDPDTKNKQLIRINNLELEVNKEKKRF